MSSAAPLSDDTTKARTTEVPKTCWQVSTSDSLAALEKAGRAMTALVDAARRTQ